MKNLIATLAIFMTPVLAFAQQTKTISCQFTEPFFSLDVDLEKKTVSRTEPDWESQDLGTKTTVIAENISLIPDFSDPVAPTYKITNADGSVILDLALNMEGSDGMSDINFPFSAFHANMWGGCESDKIKAHNPYQKSVDQK